MRDGIQYADLHVGDLAIASGGRPPIFVPGRRKWFALRVRPQREDEAGKWLSLRGVYAFHPVLPRRVMVKGKVREYQRRYLPGYVFACFKGWPIVHAVRDCPFITGALSHSSGEWGVLDPKDLPAIHAMRKVDAAGRKARRDELVQRRRKLRLREGDQVLFASGPFVEMKGELVELVADGGARIQIQLFGRPTVVDASRRDLVPILEAC